ncbi:unnamed protein product [Rotaria sp. Silwood2]|nr:unnamed protein product [Rotaria sp. Silwood2]CAF2956350.1 unnamed protein product [Rotaria sp. Silwood2]CAF2963440.1 unnamed protein product [Rotaria sp. Silwood2]CAF3102348.1 unnamed protein product [Rotaria sp. Silwood2]CAF3979196.1 unnamed protein product [Rotaria sp. Silwood2]
MSLTSLIASSAGKEISVAYCNGQACSECHKCLDWYYGPLNHIDGDPVFRPYARHLGPLVGSQANKN